MTPAADKITVVIPCKDEERNVLDCIESAKLVGDEIIVADSGSTDETIRIVYGIEGVRLIRHAWNGYSEFKNWAVQFVSHPWVLFLDADERVTPELAAEMRQKIAQAPPAIGAFTVGFRTYFLGRRLRFSNWNNRSVRLARRELCCFSDRAVHEGIAVTPKRIRHLQSKLLHFTVHNYDQYFRKYLAYSQLAAEDLKQSGKRAGVYSLLVQPFLRFLYLFVLRGGFLDGLVGIQVCVLQTFFYGFAKRARLWEMTACANQEAAAPRAGSDQPVSTLRRSVVELPQDQADGIAPANAMPESHERPIVRRRSAA
jgi:glycosyltransferase involved in cell wall biosynthesis